MTGKVLNIGIIGCGEAAQILHIPSLRELAGQFRIAALCDASRTVVDGVGAGLPEASRHTEPAALLAQGGIDAVVICLPNALHAPTAIAALEAGKHVLLEKPMCLTLAEADALAAAQARTGRLVQIGYMRRHAAAFEEAVALVAQIRDRVRYARVRAIIGPNRAFIEPTTPVIRGADVPAGQVAATDELASARLIEAIGTDQGDRATAYRLLLGLSSHDLSAMRELIGMPRRVLHATARQGGRFLTAVFDYGDFVCSFETGIDAIARFDAHIEVYGGDRTVRIDFDTPYIRHQPARLTVTEAKTPHGVSECRSHPTRGDAFVTEWRRFHDAIVNGTAIKTTIADARQDLELCARIMEHL